MAVCLGSAIMACCTIPEAMGATPILTVNDFGSSIGNSTSTTAPHIQGNVTVIATTLPLTPINIGGNLTYTGSNMITASKLVGGNNANVTSTNVQRVQFSLGVNEHVAISLTGSYSLSEAVLTASSMTWSLVGPGNVTLFSGSTTVAASGSINQALSNVSGQGTYTLLLTSTLSGSTTSNSANLATATFAGTTLTVTAVPEPVAPLICGLGSTILLVRRRRSI
ncbi:MAG: hypothetical protein EOP85_08300 [Verrucomicrobiaceae bacterium]|nr:MAG: hypothetical protein EOP85_08300 [Verrucomicrobiaceae bacterium]